MGILNPNVEVYVVCCMLQFSQNETKGVMAGCGLRILRFITRSKKSNALKFQHLQQSNRISSVMEKSPRHS